MKVQLPPEHIQFLAHGKTEGDMSIEPGRYQLWAIDTIHSLNREYAVEEFNPGHLLFGSNGGSELFAYDGKGQVVVMPAVGMCSAATKAVAQSWIDFQEKFI